MKCEFIHTHTHTYTHRHACSVMSDSLQPHGLQLVRILCPWDFPGKNTGVGYHALLQDIYIYTHTHFTLAQEYFVFYLKTKTGTSLVVQQLGLHSQCKGPSFNPWSGNQIPHVATTILLLRPSTAKQINKYCKN